MLGRWGSNILLTPRYGPVSKVSGFVSGNRVPVDLFHESVFNERVTKIENIKTELTKILRPTHFSGPKDIKTDKLFFGLIL